MTLQQDDQFDNEDQSAKKMLEIFNQKSLHSVILVQKV